MVNKAAVAAVVVGGAATTGAVGLELPAKGGEELRTLGRKACPPRVFTMVGLEEERRWRVELQMGNRDLK